MHTSMIFVFMHTSMVFDFLTIVDFVSVSVSLWNNDIGRRKVLRWWWKVVAITNQSSAKHLNHTLLSPSGPDTLWRPLVCVLNCFVAPFCSNSLSERLGCTKFIKTYEEAVCSGGNSFSGSEPAQWTALVRPFNLHLYWTDSPSSNNRQAAFSDIQMSF